MNFVKRNLDKLVYLVLIVTILVLLVINYIMVNKAKNKIIILNTPKDYLITNTYQDDVTFSLAINEKNTMYTNKDYIDNCLLLDYDTKDNYLIKLKNIENNNSMMYESNEYYNYSFHFSLPFEIDQVIEMNKCYLKLVYENQEELEINLGTISIYPLPDASDIVSLTSLRGTVDEVNNELILSSIYLSTDEEITIKDITILNTNIFVDLENTFTSTADLIHLKDLNIDYNYQGRKTIKDVICNQNGIYIPLKYEKPIEVDKLGLIIDYELDGNLYQKVVEPFQFYKSLKPINYEKVIYEINNHQ